MSDKKVIAVVGATGAQGGSLVEAILADQSRGFAVRALTRDSGSTRARALAARGAEVVQADLDDEESLRSAFRGAYGVYVVTNFWEQRAPEDVQERTRVWRRTSSGTSRSGSWQDRTRYLPARGNTDREEGERGRQRSHWGAICQGHEQGAG